MANNRSTRPVRRRRIDVNLASIDAVNEAAAASTTYFIPEERRPKRKHSSRFSSPDSPSSSIESSSGPPPPAQHAPAAQGNGVHAVVPPDPPVYSHDSGGSLDYDDSDRTEYDSTEEDELLPYDPQSTFDMVAETQNTITQAFEEVMGTIGDEWEQADGRLRSRMLASLSIALREATTNRLMALP